MKRSLASVAAVLMVGLAGCTGGDTTPEKVDLVVFLESDVTAEQRAAVEQRMRATSNVEGVTLETREQAYEKFKQQFKDQPDMWQQTKPEYMPESFVATVNDASIAEAVEIMLDTVEGVDDIVIRATSEYAKAETVGVILRLADGVTGDQRTAIDKAVHALPKAKSIEFESPEDAFKRLKKRCGEKSDLAAALDPAKTSASIRFKIGLEEPSPGLDALQKLDGVEAVRFVPVSML